MSVSEKHNQAAPESNTEHMAFPLKKFTQQALIVLLVLGILAFFTNNIARRYGIVYQDGTWYFRAHIEKEEEHNWFHYDIWINDIPEVSETNVAFYYDVDGTKVGPNDITQEKINSIGIQVLFTKNEANGAKCYRALSGWVTKPTVITVEVYQKDPKTGELGALIQSETIRVSPFLPVFWTC